MAYLVKLAQFEGPLDLLLHLINKAKIDLQDIFVSEITEQYLRYMEQIGTVDMDRASDFLNIAATLLYIKSRSLLPGKRDLEERGEEGIDPETELINRLRAYKLYKDAGEQLKQYENAAKDVFYKLPEELFAGQQELVIEDADADALFLAFLSVLKNKRERRPDDIPSVEIRHDMFSIRKQKGKLLSRLKQQKRMSFFSVFEEDATQMEVAVTFVALLELWHLGRLLVRQRSSFGDIMLEYLEGGEAS